MTSFFGRSRKQEPGWLAVVPMSGGAGIAHVVQSAGKAVRPQVLRYEFCTFAQDDAKAWEKFSKDSRLERYRCTTLLAPGEYQLLLVDAVNVPPAELKAAIRWRIKDMLAYHIDDATIDVLDIPQQKDAPSRGHSMYAVAAPNEIIQKRVTRFEESKIPLSVIDIQEMAQRNIAALYEATNRGLALLAFGQDSGLLTITYGGELYLSRRIEVAPGELHDADETLRQQHLDRLTLEVQRSLDYFDRQYNYITLNKLLLAPFSSPAQGEAVREYLASNLSIAVEPLRLGDAIDFSATPELNEPEQQAQAFFALGAALRQEERAL